MGLPSGAIRVYFLIIILDVQMFCVFAFYLSGLFTKGSLTTGKYSTI